MKYYKYLRYVIVNKLSIKDIKNFRSINVSIKNNIFEYYITIYTINNYLHASALQKIFNRIKASSKGGRAGQWSARKAQMLAKAYKKAGGGYK